MGPGGGGGNEERGKWEDERVDDRVTSVLLVSSAFLSMVGLGVLG